MLYISSTCIKHDTIAQTVEDLARNGFTHIELSGGTKFYAGIEEDLIRLKEQYHLNYLVHGYFPPPPEDFILNLGSLNDGTYQKSLRHYEKAIVLSQVLGAKKFGLHAGFFFELSLQDIGRQITKSALFDRTASIARFCEGYQYLKTCAQDVELYVENNVLSQANAKVFDQLKPVMLIDVEDYRELKSKLDFNLLLDVAHLNVSTQALGLDIHQQLAGLVPYTNYIHISENDGASDQSQCFVNEEGVLSLLKGYNVSSTTITCETYGTIDKVKSSQLLVSKTLGFHNS